VDVELEASRLVGAEWDRAVEGLESDGVSEAKSASRRSRGDGTLSS
jgi:hypothetical protein